MLDHGGHRAEDGAARRNAGAQQIDDVLHLPIAQAGFAARGERGRIPVLHGDQAARNIVVADGAEQVARGMAGIAMAQAFHQVGAAVPLLALFRVVLVFAILEIQRAPAGEQLALVEGEAHFMRPALQLHRLDRHEISVHRVAVFARDLGVVGEGHRRIEQRAVFRFAFVQRAPEVVGAPVADAGFLVGRNVRREQAAEGRGHFQAAGIGLAAAHRVAGVAVAGRGEVEAAGDGVLRRLGADAGGRRRVALRAGGGEYRDGDAQDD